MTPYVPAAPANPLEGLQIKDLVAAFQKALRKMVVRNTVTKIRRDEISVKDRMKEVIFTVKQKRRTCSVLPPV